MFERFIDLAYPREGNVSQVIFSTHSPYLVDLFSEMTDSVQIVEQAEGRTRITPLQDIRTEKLHQEGAVDGPIGQHWARGLYEGL